MAQGMRGSDGARPACFMGLHSPHLQHLLTNPEFEIVEGMLVDLLYALSQGEGEVSQGAQMSPLVFTLLEQRGEKNSFTVANMNLSAAGACPMYPPTCVLLRWR